MTQFSDRARWRLRAAGTIALLALSAATLRAQNIISVPFTAGFIGTRGTSAGTANNVLTYATLGIARTFFIQNSSTNQFEIQGNDIPGTLRLVRTNGTTVDIPASVNWRNSGGTTYLIGILPRPASPITWTYGSGSSIQITNGSSNGGSSIGGYIAGNSTTPLADGQSTNGNAAQSGALNGLNSYLATVVQSRPAGPVTVTALTTTSTSPTISGTVTLAVGETFAVVVNGKQYTTSSSPALTIVGTTWSLTPSPALSVGTYEVTATITNADGFTLSDATTNELVINASTGTVTIGGSFTANNKQYDRTTAATGNTGSLTLSGVNGGDQVTIASVTLAFQSSGVGTGKTVVISAVTLGGTNGGSYTVNLAGAPTATANITAKPLTLSGSFTASNKQYDRTTAATMATNSLTLNGVIAPDAVSINSVTAAFGTATVANGKTVSLTAATITGADAGNYSISVAGAPTTTANITAKPLTITGSFTASDKNYDGNTSATIATNSLALSGVIAPDAVSLTSETAAFGTAGVGANKTVSLASASLTGADAANYSLTLSGAPTTTASILAVGTAITVSGTFTASNKVYDRTTTATGNTTGLTLVGVNGGDQVSIAAVSLDFQSAPVGTGKTVVISSITLGGANAGSYSVDLTGAPTATADITPAPLTFTGSFTASNKEYDRTTSATLATNGLTLSGVVAPDVVSINSVTAAFGTATVANGKTVSLTAATITGADASNYSISVSGAPTTTANITAKPLTIGGSFTANNKPFDGTAAATIGTNSLTLPGVIAPDVVSLTGVSAVFSSATVANGKTVSLSAASLTGGDAGNYSLSLSGAPTTTANITPVGGPVTISGTLRADNKVYDRTTNATGTLSGLTLVGVSGGHQVAISEAVLAFDDAAVGTGKTVRIVSVTLGGTNAGLYSVDYTGAPTTTAAITPRTVTLTGAFTASDKRFDNTTGATVTSHTLTVQNIVAPDAITVTDLEAAFDSPAVGTNKPVSLTNARLSGTGNANYTLSLIGAPRTTASITALTPPGAPTNVQLTSGDRQLTVSWQLPLTEGCSLVTGYTVSWSLDGTTWTTLTVNGRTTLSAVIAPLTNNQPVQVRVTARNECGESAPSAIAGPVAPVGPAPVGPTGAPPTVPPGNGTTTTPAGTVPVTTTVVQDTTLRLTAGPITLSLRSKDQSGAPIAVDTNKAIVLDRGGQAATDGTGFKPATVVTLYLYPKNGTPILLGTIPVTANGTFAGAGLIPASLPPGEYTLQVIGIDNTGTPRSAALGVTVTDPPPMLEFAVTPSTVTPAVGDTITLTLTVTNIGTGAATNVVIPRAFNEPGFRIVQTTPLDGRYDAASMTWTIDRIEAGGVARLRFTAIVLPPTGTEGLRP